MEQETVVLERVFNGARLVGGRRTAGRRRVRLCDHRSRFGRFGHGQPADGGGRLERAAAGGRRRRDVPLRHTGPRGQPAGHQQGLAVQDGAADQDRRLSGLQRLPVSRRRRRRAGLDVLVRLDA